MATLLDASQTKGGRTADGHPDFQGVYEFGTQTRMQRPSKFEGKPYVTDAEAAAYVKQRLESRNSDRRLADPKADLQAMVNEFWWDRPTDMLRVNGRILTSRVTDPPDGKIPAWTAAVRQRIDARGRPDPEVGPLNNPEDLEFLGRCLSPVPIISAGVDGNILQIIQTPQDVSIHWENMNVLRVVSLTRKEHVSARVRSRGGDSIGRWEGDTLFVDTTNFGGEFGAEFTGVDENLHIIERLSRAGADLLYEATVEDPTAYVRPWTSVLVFHPTDSRMFEFACHEGNYSMENTLRGARTEERQVKKQ